MRSMAATSDGSNWELAMGVGVRGVSITRALIYTCRDACQMFLILATRKCQQRCRKTTSLVPIARNLGRDVVGAVPLVRQAACIVSKRISG
jgi:hypothetical protein